MVLLKHKTKIITPVIFISWLSRAIDGLDLDKTGLERKEVQQ